ncbi:MAG TPA: hypothetical protein VH186_27605 [Chloroflexia bacterium]|nr:hypothetical protein [Chloroflexia bacterium]
MFWKKKETRISREEIERIWGSYEAYLEEQRRCGLWLLEYETRDCIKSQPLGSSLQSELSQPASNEVTAPSEMVPSKVSLEISGRERNYLVFLRWLYKEGKLRS